MNSAVWAQLSRRFEMRYVGPVNPSGHIADRVISKVRRLISIPGAYHFFSGNRLALIASQVNDASDINADFDYFHGITPWIATTKRRPTFAFADACFHTYYETYQKGHNFSRYDLCRIENLERSWLQQLDAIFFTSRYALEETLSAYKLDGENCHYVGMGSNIQAGGRDWHRESLKLLFVAVDFFRKGGPVCVEAFKAVRANFSQAELVIVGDKPPQDVIALQGVEYAGFLNKKEADQRERLCQLFASAFVLVLPTISDMTPLVIAEAGKFGCPTIAPRSFGIPEMIVHGVTGALVSAPPVAAEIAEVISGWHANRETYLEMRDSVRIHSQREFDWQIVVSRIAEKIGHSVSNIAQERLTTRDSE